MRALVVVVVVLLCIEVAHVHCNVPACDPHGHTNGCSIPLDLPSFYKRLFTPSCNRHDICYGCGSRYGIYKERCDDAFLRDMKSACGSGFRRRRQVDKRDACEFWADRYYDAVDLFGGANYDSSPDRYCGEPWVRSCLP